MTVTLAAPKIPLVLPPADAHCGDLVIADIGIPLPILDEVEGPYIEILTRERMREIVPARAADSHKGDFGRVLIVAGSFGKTGAAHLAATGALRSGAGLVTIATPRSCVPIVAAMGAGVHDRAPRGDVRRRDRLRRGRSRARHAGGRDRDRPRARPGSVHRRLRAGHRRTRRRSARARRRCAERVLRRRRAADGARRRGHDHHAAPGRDGAAAQHQHRGRPARSPAARIGIRRHAPPARRAEGAPHGRSRAPTTGRSST